MYFWFFKKNHNGFDVFIFTLFVIVWKNILQCRCRDADNLDPECKNILATHTENLFFLNNSAKKPFFLCWKTNIKHI